LNQSFGYRCSDLILSGQSFCSDLDEKFYANAKSLLPKNRLEFRGSSSGKRKNQEVDIYNSGFDRLYLHKGIWKLFYWPGMISAPEILLTLEMMQNNNR
jgi:hypothetical protein